MNENRNSGFVQWVSGNRVKVAGTLVTILLTAIIAPIVVDRLTREPEIAEVRILNFDPTPSPEDPHTAGTLIDTEVSLYNEGTTTARNCRLRVYEGDGDPVESQPFSVAPDDKTVIPVVIILPSKLPEGALLVGRHRVAARAHCNNDTSDILHHRISYLKALS